MVGALAKNLHELSIWAIRREVLSPIVHKSIFLHFVHHCTKVYDKYINTYYRKKYIDDDGSGIFPKQKARKLYNEKYQEKYGNERSVVSTPYIKDARIQRM